MNLKQRCILVGPFIGCFQWEVYRFIPHILYRAKAETDKIFIVFSRPSMFDFYGRYADILVPLYLDDNYDETKGFSFEIDVGVYRDLCFQFVKRYSKRFVITEHIKPDIREWRYKVKWQFSRDNVIYDFQPRKKNKEIIDVLYTNRKYIISDNDIYDVNEPIVSLKSLYKNIKEVDGFNKSFTFYGCLVELFKKCKIYIGSLTTIGNLPLLLRVPVITNTVFTDDELSLINPLDTKVVMTSDMKEGIKYYENNF